MRVCEDVVGGVYESMKEEERRRGQDTTNGTV